MASPFILPKKLEYRSPLVGDVFVYKDIQISRPDNVAPAFGTPCDIMNAAKVSWPNHKFAWREQIGEGLYRDVYIADLPTQHLYNWQTITNEPTWKTIRQVFVILRSVYNENPANPETTYPPPPSDKVNTTGYIITSVTESRSGDSRIDSLYVLIEVIREKINVPLQGYKFDPDTGKLNPVYTQKVPAGTPGSTINDDGTITEISPSNTQWSISTTRQASGLAGSAIDGVASRTWDYVDDYYWPRILDYIHIRGGSATGFAVTPIYFVDQYNGPCRMTMLERWTIDPPVEVLPTVLLPEDITFNGLYLDVRIPHSLHVGLPIFEPGFYQYYNATNYIYWPQTIVASVTVEPDQGGWIQRIITVHAPLEKGVGPIIKLTANDADFDSFVLNWEGGTPGATTVNVSTDPTFQTGFLPGYQGLVVASGVNTVIVNGAAQGGYYYAQLKRGLVASNIVLVGTQSAPLIQVSVNGVIKPTGSASTLPSAGVGQSTSQTIVVTNVGALQLSITSISMVGANADQFDISDISDTYLETNQSATITVQFSPTSGGTKTASIQIFSDSASGSPFILGVNATAIAPILRVNYPFGTTINPGGIVDFGTYVDTPINRTIYLRNFGDADLAGISAQISGFNADDFIITVQPSDLVSPSSSSPLTVQFIPSDDDSLGNNRSAILTITSNDPVNPSFDVNLTGFFDNPDAPGSVELDISVTGTVLCIAQQADGKTVVGGLFSNINGVPLANLARINSDGSIDGTFSASTDGSVRSLAVQRDGKIIAGGDFSTVNGDPFPYLVRFNSMGIVDGTFTPFLGASVYAIAIQTDGKVLCGGEFQEPADYIARFDYSGGYDSGFVTEVNGIVRTISLLPDGKMIIGGNWAGSDIPTTTTTPSPTTTTTPEPTTTTTPEPTTTTPEPTTTTSTTTTPSPTTTTTSTTTTSTTTTSTTTTSEPTTTTQTPTTTTEAPIEPKGGCMDISASNYDSSATFDDGSCIYPP